MNKTPNIQSVEVYTKQLEEEAKKNGKPKPRLNPNVNYTSFVNNGTQTATTTTTEKVSVAAISGPSEISAGELATYTITAYNGEPTEEDKKKIFWSVYIDGKRNHRIRIAKNIERKIADDSKTDIYTDKNKRNSDLIIYALISPSEDKLEIKFSKWFDGRPNIKVEAHAGRNSFDKSCQQETKVKAKPEIISINWVNAKEQKITYAGYDQDVFLSIKTLGLKDKELNLDIFDYDETNEDDKLNWGNNTISITGRKVLKQFPIKKRSEYDLPQKDERTTALELYAVPYSSEPLENCKDKYATYLNLTPNEKIITGYFAEERKREAQKGEEEKPKEQPKPQVEPTPKVHTVVKDDTMYDVAKSYGVESYKVLRKYNNLKSNSLSVGQKLKIPPKKATEKPKEEEKDTKTITYYQKIDTTSLGSEVHLIAETQNLEGKTVTFTLFEKDPVLLKEKDQPLPFLVGEEEKTKVEAIVNDGKAQVKIQLRKKENKAHQEWKDILSPPDEPLKDIWYDAINDQHVHMTKEEKDYLELTSSIFFITPSVQYIPAVIKHEKKNTYLWLQVSCEGEQEDFDEKYLQQSPLKIYAGINHTFDKKYVAKEKEAYINIIAPKERHLQGPLVVFNESDILFKTHSLARGSNPNRIKGGGNGDTPTGKTTTSYNSKRHNGKYSYGNHGLIYLTGKTSEFLKATNSGRAGIAIHAGHTVGYYRKSLEDKGQLMSTYGCVRVYNNEMKKLGELYKKLKKEGYTIYGYIEDYDGDIKDVYKFYNMESDPKDTAQSSRTTTQ